MSEPLIVLGLGNPLLGDDGLGVRAIEALRMQRVPPRVHLLDGGVGGLDWYGLLTGNAQGVWLIDAVKRDGAAAGTIVDGENVAVEQCRAGPAVSGHDLTIAHALRLADALGEPIVPLRLYGIVVAPRDFGESLTAPVAAALPRLVARVREALWTHAPHTRLAST